MSEARQPYDTGSGQIEATRLTARVSALERAQLNLQARIEELAEDMDKSFLQQTKYLEQVIAEKIAVSEARMLAAFQQVIALLNERLPPPQKQQ